MAKTYRPIIPEGTHLASSRNTRGAKRGTLLDDITNQVVGQAEFVEENESFQSDTVKGTIVKGAMLGATAYVAAKVIENSKQNNTVSEKERIKQEVYAEAYRRKVIKKLEKKEHRKAIIKEYLKRAAILACKYIWIGFVWCIKKIFIGVKIASKWIYMKFKQHITKIKVVKSANNQKKENAQQIYSIRSMTPTQFSGLVDDAVEKFEENMSSQEFQMHLIKVLLLSIELSKEIRILSNFKTNNTQNHTTDYLAWQSAMEKLTTEKVLEYINYILVNYGNILEEREKEAIVINFYNGFYNSQGFIPMSREQIQEALKLNVD